MQDVAVRKDILFAKQACSRINLSTLGTKMPHRARMLTHGSAAVGTERSNRATRVQASEQLGASA